MNKFIAAFVYIKARLSEPSTMTALATICVLLNTKIDAEAIQSALNVGTLVFGTLGFFIKEDKAN